MSDYRYEIEGIGRFRLSFINGLYRFLNVGNATLGQVLVEKLPGIFNLGDGRVYTVRYVPTGITITTWVDTEEKAKRLFRDLKEVCTKHLAPLKPEEPTYEYGQGDTVIFTLPSGEAVSYRVRDSYLSTDKGANDLIFHELGLGYEEMFEFCEKAYGYESREGNFPQYAYGDYAAANRVIKAIRDHIQSLSLKPNTDEQVSSESGSLKPGETRRGNSVSSRRSSSTVASGQLRNTAITGAKERGTVKSSKLLSFRKQ